MRGQDPESTRPVGGQNWPRVVAIVLNWNGWQDTVECLESLQGLKYPAQRVVLVDNGSTDDSLEQIKAWARGEIRVVSPVLGGSPAVKPVVWVEYERGLAEAGGAAEEESVLEAARADRRLVIIRTERNLGFAGGMNVGIRYACVRGAEYVWLLNNDTVVEAGTLTDLISAIADLDSVGIAGPLCLDYYQPQSVVDSIGVIRPWRGVIGGVPKTLRLDERGRADVELIYGFNMLVSAASMRAAGLMDERFFLYVEETEWCVRMRRKGWRLVYVSTSRAWHKGARSTGWGSSLMYYYIARNQLWLFSMHFPYAVPCALARSALRAMKLLRHRRWVQWRAVIQGCLDWARGRFGRAPRYSPIRRPNADEPSRGAHG